MESARNVKSFRKLNTKGCCFLCLRSEKINENEDHVKVNQDNQNFKSVFKYISIRSLLRHLQIPTSRSVDEIPIFGEDFKNEDIQVDLCENCGQMITRFSVLFQELEKIHLEMDYFLERVYNCISQSAKAPQLVQNYSKRMTSDFEALSQLAFVDNLRKQVAKKCSKELNVPRLQVILTRPNNKLIKSENTDDEPTSESNGGDFPEQIDNPAEISFPDLTFSAPPSPISTEFNEEEVKFSESSASKTENELSAPLKMPIKRRNQRSKYFTKILSTGMYECNECGKKSKSRNTIEYHFKSVHLKIKYKCDICNIAVFNNLPNLNAHKKTCREKLEIKLAKEKDPKFKFICKICGKRFDANLKLVNHTYGVHKNANRYPCDLCDKKYKSKAKLKNHQAVIHQSRKFHCKICNKIYKDLGKYKKHERNCVDVKVKLEIV